MARHRQPRDKKGRREAKYWQDSGPSWKPAPTRTPPAAGQTEVFPSRATDASLTNLKPSEVATSSTDERPSTDSNR